MRNIIEYLWQAKYDQPIFNTLIQSPHHPPHLYFYSTKQHRVLRKKESTDAITYLDEHNPPDTRSLLLIYTHPSTLQLTLLFSQSALTQAVLKSKTDQAIVILSRQNQQLELIEVNIYKGKVSKVNRFLQWGKTVCKIDRQAQLKIDPNLEKYCHQIFSFLEKFCKSNPLFINLILSQTAQQFVLVWVNTVNTLPPTFFDFDYALVIEKEESEGNREEGNREEKNREELEGQECVGCGRVTVLQKEVSGEEVVCLRRKKGLSIRHILQVSYLICQQCFQE